MPEINLTVNEKTLAKCHEILKSLVGSDELIQQWWISPNRAFNGEIPDDLWNTTAGRNQVFNYLLDQMEAPH